VSGFPSFLQYSSPIFLRSPSSPSPPPPAVLSVSPKHPPLHTTLSPEPTFNTLSSLLRAVLLLLCPLPGYVEGTVSGCGCTRAHGSWDPHVVTLPSQPLSPGTGRAEPYLPFLATSGAPACHQNFGGKWLPLQKLLRGNKKR